MMLGMRFLPNFGRYESVAQSKEHAAGVETKGAGGADKVSLGDDFGEDSHLLKTVGWISAALGAVALGLIVGRELRLRYKFNRRTPYDLYSHSGDELPDVDSGVGI
jgi:hypothetical protein